jgi:cytochrome c oxidase subunit 6c
MAAAKPQLRGLLASSLKTQVIVASVLGIGSVVLVKHFVKDARLKRYEEFYKHYDVEKDFERMRRTGIFRSAPAGDEPEPKAAAGKKK